MSRYFDLGRTPCRQVFSDNVEYALRQLTSPQIFDHV